MGGEPLILIAGFFSRRPAPPAPRFSSGVYTQRATWLIARNRRYALRMRLRFLATFLVALRVSMTNGACCVIMSKS